MDGWMDGSSVIRSHLAGIVLLKQGRTEGRKVRNRRQKAKGIDDRKEGK
jgi:hypothetical protein